MTTTRDMIKINVSPRQMAYYKKAYEGDKVDFLKRMIQEFKLGLSMAREVYEQFPNSFHIRTTSNRPFLPSHPRDDRAAIYLPEPIVERLDGLMADIFDGDDPYERFMEISSEHRESVYAVLSDEFPDEAEDQLHNAVRQYPFGIMPITSARSMENIEEMSQMLRDQIEEGRDISQVSSDFLHSSVHWAESERVAAYISVAEILYEYAQLKMDEIRGKMAT